MSDPKFIHLHIHSDYSIVDGLAKTDSLIKKAVSIKMPSIAITDYNNLYGLIKFYKGAHKVGIKPIIGADFIIKSEILQGELNELTILASNNTGYHNLVMLISEAHKEGYDSIGPIINYDHLIKYNDGLILLSGSYKGDIGRLLVINDIYKTEQCIKFYKNYFPNRFYLELTRTGKENEENYLKAAVKLASIKKIPIVATNNVRFVNLNDFYDHELRVAIQKGLSIDKSKSCSEYTPQQYMKDENEMCALFSDLPSALINSVEIAKRCNVNLTLGKYFLPNFPTGKVHISNYLIKCAHDGLEERLKLLFPNINTRKIKRPLYEMRLNTELKIINQMGLPGYFLIVMEFIQWSKNNHIPVGPGRGSGAGSLVSYVLKITNIDPLSFNLLFERFLNPERTSMPDIDVDFCVEKRDLVIEHVIKKYGQEAVSQIITFGTMTAKSVIRDVGRALSYPYRIINHVSKLIPSDLGITLEKALIIESRLRELYSSDEDIKELIDTSRKLEGIIRNVSKHAGGIVISPTKVTDFVPLYYDNTGNNPVTQFDKDDIEAVGLMKFDFLGLRTLTIIDLTVKLINSCNIDQKDNHINIDNISLKDEKSFALLRTGNTTAVFQLESFGMQNLIKRLQPDCFEDIIALIALFRPGPLQSGMVDNFINRKHGNETISYPDIKCQHHLLKPILKSTYGIILYQEQVMQIAQTLAGYTLGEADILRRAMGKKKRDIMEKQRYMFKQGSKSLGIDEELSMRIFDLMEKFSGYGFNKSHSAAYALISYQTLWLKAHYPSEFMAATMTADMYNTEKIVKLINECSRMGLKVLPPNINISEYHFHVNKNKEIIYGMGAIKGIGKIHVNSIINARSKGIFQDIFNLCMRVDTKKINRRILEKLIMSGTLDCFNLSRTKLIHLIDNAIKVSEQYNTNNYIGQIDMFGINTENLKEINNLNQNINSYSEENTLNNEIKILGLNLSKYSIIQYENEIIYYTNGMNLRDIKYLKTNKEVTLAGFLISIKKIITKRNNEITILTLDDNYDQLEVIVFKKEKIKYFNVLRNNSLLIIKGRVIFNKFKNLYKIIANEIMGIQEARKKYICKIKVFLDEKQNNDLLLKRISSLIELYQPGTIPLSIYRKQKELNILSYFRKGNMVIPSESLIDDLKNLVGKEKVKLEF